MIHTDLGGYHFLGGVKVREISLQRLHSQDSVFGFQAINTSAANGPTPNMYQSLCWSQGLGHYGARTGTVGGSFDSRRARAGSLGTPDLFAEHQRRA